MSGALARIGRVAVTEWAVAVRSRRALVVTLLFLAVSGGLMYALVSVFASLEETLVETLNLPSSDSTGSVTMTLWKSKPFTRMIQHFAGSSLVFVDIQGRHPIVLAYAMLVFWCAPLLTLMVSASRVADDIRSGAARYWLVRVTRTEWSLGKMLGEALMLATAMGIGALAADAVVCARLPLADGIRLLPDVLDWTVRAWGYAFAWLGIFMGLSHLVKSGGKATALGVLAMLGAAAWEPMLRNLAENVAGLGWVGHLDALVPGSAWTLLWRRSPAVVLQGVVHLAALAFLYLALGAAVLRRRDV